LIYFTNTYWSNDDLTKRHIYLIDKTAEIKEGDWYYSKALNSIFKAEILPLSLKDAVKIIASTDSSLQWAEGGYPYELQIHGIPQLSEQSIKLLIDYYNNNGLLPESVKVKKDKYGNVPYYYIHGNCKYECEHKGNWFDLTNGQVEMTKSEEELIKLNANKIYYSLKLNSQGTVNIYIPEERMYSKNEVEILLLKAIRDSLKSVRLFQKGKESIINQDNWIKENLK
jgi:hypothetical protein